MKLKTILFAALFAPMFANAYNLNDHQRVWDNGNPFFHEEIVVDEVFAKDTHKFVKCEMVIGREHLGQMAIGIEGTNVNDLRYQSTYIYNDSMRWKMAIDGEMIETRGAVANEDDMAANVVPVDPSVLSKIRYGSTMTIYQRLPRTHGSKFKREDVELDGTLRGVGKLYDCLEMSHHVYKG